MTFFQNEKWFRILFWVWAAILFAGVRLILAVPLRNQWGPQQLTAACTANLCSVLSFVGVILPLIPERKRLAALGLMPFMRFASRYLVLSHLMVVVLAAFIAVSIVLDWSIQVQGSGLTFFIVSCFLLFRFTVKN
ncbi:hypothetical protein J1782_24135 [Rahnella sp. BCC 1045]|uniref:hypothetical protein n=1 Tax=Rahnella sp. BCC 1045 TaxID=2816251 RepID=UPI001C252F9E|nr:hypothetical protein [Rahnella sp. BCC 1045]MBU9822985.1 hypothetical protein [Rahnella sp. BCC 1045]